MEQCEVAHPDYENKCWHCRLDGKWCKTDADFDKCRYGIIIQQYKEKYHGNDTNN